MTKSLLALTLLIGIGSSTATAQPYNKQVMNFGLVNPQQVEYGRAFPKANTRTLSPSVVSERVSFTTFLKQLRPAYMVKYGITPEQLRLLGTSVDKRLSQLGPAFFELEKKWQSLTPDEQKLGMSEFLAADERLATIVRDEIDEILSPGQRDGLLQTYLEMGSEYEIFSDPIAYHSLGLSASDAAFMKARKEEAAAFFFEKAQTLGISGDWPENESKEMRRLQALMWSKLDPVKVEKIMRMRGLLRPSEDLTAYLDRNPLDKEALVLHASAFGQAVKLKEKKEKK